MSVKEKLCDLCGSIATATTDSPDEYPDWSYWTYETHMAHIKELWEEIRPQLKRDLEGAEFVDSKLREMIEAFDAGEKERGRDVAWELYNFDVEKLR
jgi:hypothetical protein